MTGTFLDVDAPNTAWRSGSEDPIPVVLGRYSKTAFVYRFLTCRPLDGVARTDATFFHAGTRALTRSGRTMPYNYWPGWKRGLLMTRLPAFGLLPYSAIVAFNEHAEFADGWVWHAPGPALAWTPLAGYGAVQAVQYVRNFQHERQYVRPLRNAVIATLRTRDSVALDIPRGLVHGRDVDSTGRIWLPSAHPLGEGDRDNLLTAVRERLGHDALDARWNMEGAKPHMELYTPPQPPDRVSWEIMLAHANVVRPYLGHSASGPVHWDLGDDSPHIGVAGGSGSGKSELAGWIVAQFMRGGAGVVVLDPKYSSHRWLASIRDVLYCREPAMIHDTIMWLDAELRRRGLASVHSEEEFDRIAVLLEERNSMQTLLREHWAETRPRGAPMRSPALAALDRLASQGRSLNINVILAAQETARVDIGSRNSYGAFCLAGRLPVPSWRLVMGPGAKKPAMSSKPGRFGYVVAGAATVFQGAYPDLKRHSDRLVEYATGGVPMLNVAELMQQHETPAFPSSAPVAAEDSTDSYVTLSQFADQAEVSLGWLQTHRQRDGRGFPDSVGRGDKNAHLYRTEDLYDWLALRREVGEEPE